ncbi:MAG TPA: tetratricopeptide repeat protein [Candidatus Methylomirabilis sp.]|nr:tetratricopeptide repeat protein [Candidatus Methylomirabilis sp.]
MHRAIAAFLCILWLTGVGGVPADAASRPVLSSAPAGGSPFLSAVLRHSAQGSRDLLGVPVDPSLPEREIARLADRLRYEVTGAADGGEVVSAFRRILLVEEGFTYDKSASDPGNYLLESVLARKKGNCLGLSMLYLALADRLGLPFRGVYVPSHCFVRYEGGGVPRNVEFGEGGASWEDDRYRREFRVRPGRPYLFSLASAEMLGVFLKTLGAGYARKGREEDALRLYDEAGRLYPGLPDIHYNAGVSLQKLGRQDEAEGKYRRALDLDPEMAAARDNLGVLMARQGRYDEAIEEARRAVELDPRNAATRGNLAAAYCGCGRLDEGIREYRMAVEIDPGNRRAQSGLARAYFSRGSYREAATACDSAEALGCRFDAAMLETLSRYRDGRPLREASP